MSSGLPQPPPGGAAGGGGGGTSSIGPSQADPPRRPHFSLPPTLPTSGRAPSGEGGSSTTSTIGGATAGPSVAGGGVSALPPSVLMLQGTPKSFRDRFTSKNFHTHLPPTSRQGNTSTITISPRSGPPTGSLRKNRKDDRRESGLGTGGRLSNTFILKGKGGIGYEDSDEDENDGKGGGGMEIDPSMHPKSVSQQPGGGRKRASRKKRDVMEMSRDREVDDELNVDLSQSAKARMMARSEEQRQGIGSAKGKGRLKGGLRRIKPPKEGEDAEREGEGSSIGNSKDTQLELEVSDTTTEEGEDEEGEEEQWGMLDRMRCWRNDALTQHLYETAKFWGSKIWRITGDANDGFWLAQAHYLTSQFAEAERILTSRAPHQPIQHLAASQNNAFASGSNPDEDDADRRPTQANFSLPKVDSMKQNNPVQGVGAPSTKPVLKPTGDTFSSRGPGLGLGFPPEFKPAPSKQPFRLKPIEDLGFGIGSWSTQEGDTQSPGSSRQQSQQQSSAARNPSRLTRFAATHDTPTRRPGPINPIPVPPPPMEPQRLLDQSVACRVLAARAMIRLEKWEAAMNTVGAINPFRGGLESSEDIKGTDGGVKFEASMCHLRGLIHLRENKTEDAKGCFMEALSLDVKCYDSFDALVKENLMEVDEEWEFVQGLSYHAQLDADAEFVKMMYLTRLKKYKHREEMADCRKRLIIEYGLGEDPDVLLGLAEELYESYRWADCYAITSKILAKSRGHQNTLPLHLACMHHLPRLRSRLFLLAHELIDEDPESAVSWYAVALWYFSGRRWDEARRYSHRSNLADGRFGPAWLCAGHCFAHEGEHDQAIAAYSTAQRKFKGTHLPVMFIGMQHLQLGNTMLAEEFLTSAYEICQIDPLLISEIGTVAYYKGQYEDAIQRYLDALNLARNIQSPESAWSTTLLNLGHAYRMNNQYLEAYHVLLKAIELRPQWPSALAAMGMVLHHLDRVDEAVERYHEALALTPSDPLLTTLLDLALTDLAEFSLPPYIARQSAKGPIHLPGLSSVVAKRLDHDLEEAEEDGWDEVLGLKDGVAMESEAEDDDDDDDGQGLSGGGGGDTTGTRTEGATTGYAEEDEADSSSDPDESDEDEEDTDDDDDDDDGDDKEDGNAVGDGTEGNSNQMEMD